MPKAYSLVPISAVVLLISLFSSWFIVNRDKENVVSQKVGDNDGSQNRDIVSKLTRIDPVEVGYVRELNLVPGKVHKMRTLSLRPALFEIQDFLTEQECRDIILMAETQGLERSLTVGEQTYDPNNYDSTNDSRLHEDSAEIFKNLDLNSDGNLDVREVAGGLLELGRVIVNEEDTKTIMSDLNLDPNKDGVITLDEFSSLVSEIKTKEIMDYLEEIHKTNVNKRARDSSTAFLDPYEHSDFRPLFESLRDRIHSATQLPKDMIWSSENMQVIKYEKKQHYHCHFDSEEENRRDLPCCHYALSYDEENLECIPCRFLTVFYYLNEPKFGGETAFPIADNETIPENEMHLVGNLDNCNLAEHCHDANLYYKPKLGTALLWYNHFVSNETGWLGTMDHASYHGGCNVIEGTKWAANNWINAGVDREADFKIWEMVRMAEEDYQERMKLEPWEQQTTGNVEKKGEDTPKEQESSENEKKTGEEDKRDKGSEENE